MRGVNWCFTDFELLDFGQIFSSHGTDNDGCIKYIAWGLEKCPDTGRMHNQGWVQFADRKRLVGVKKILGSKVIHVEPCRGTEESNDKYCGKAGQLMTLGTWTKQGCRNDIVALVEKALGGASVEELLIEDPVTYSRARNTVRDAVEIGAKKMGKKWRDVNVRVYSGETGVGKTRTAVEETDYMIHANDLRWWNGYCGEEAICIDEFANQIPITELLNLLDGHPKRLELKGSVTWARWTTVVLTTNLAWDQWYPNARPVHRNALQRRINEWRTMDGSDKNGRK